MAHDNFNRKNIKAARKAMKDNLFGKPTVMTIKSRAPEQTTISKEVRKENAEIITRV